MGAVRFLLLAVVSSFLCGLPSFCQDSQSLADAARQARLQKQKSVDAQTLPTSETDSPASKTPRVITNDEIPEHVDSSITSGRTSYAQERVRTSEDYGNQKLSAEQWKSKIQAQKSSIASLQREIAAVTASIHFPEHCLRNCVARNERQIQKENHVDEMKAQLAEQQKRLEDLQESARKQGFGNSVYEP